MNQPLPNYRSYLIRFWRVDNAGHPRPGGTWRVGLQEPGSETQLYFESLAALCAYLAAQLGSVAAQATSGDDQE
jgi:hypothetical protein